MTAVFDISAAGEPLSQVAEVCGWTLDASPVAPSVAESRRSDRERLYTEGEEAFARGDMARARAAYLRASEFGEPWAPPLFRLGLIALNDGDIPGALEHFEEVVRLAPDSPEGAQAAQVLRQLQR